MATPYAKSGAVMGIRLHDIPVQIRRRYGRVLYEHAVKDGDLELAIRLNAAIERPSLRVYWLPRKIVFEARRKQQW